jgi:hypothetical protein
VGTKYFEVLQTVFLRRFLGAFTRSQEATTSFVMSVLLSTWNSSVPSGRIFIKF